MNSNELLLQGLAALKAKNFERAEEVLLAAYQSCVGKPQRSTLPDPRSTVCVALGKVYRQTGRYEDAITVFEKALPLPSAFSELVSVFRVLGKAAKKEGDLQNSAGWYRQMFCLAKIEALAMNAGRTMTNMFDWGKATQAVDEIRRQYGTLYAFTLSDADRLESSLLSKADCKAISESI